MCGRFAFYSPAEATAALFDISAVPEMKPRYNIAPTQDIAAIRKTADGGAELAMLRWGLVPFWAKDPAIGNRMINARAETIAEKPAFRAAYRRRRNLVLADGFYEWRQEAGGKIPYFISLAANEAFLLAALWESWTDKATGEVLETTTLITTAANPFMEPLHHRMPVILDREGGKRWLAGEDVLGEAAANTPSLVAWPVDRRVNDARNEGDFLVEPRGELIAG